MKDQREARSPQSLKNALEQVVWLINKKKTMDAKRAKLDPHRQLCEEEMMKQRPYAIVDDAVYGALKTIKTATKRWIKFEDIARTDVTYRQAIRAIRNVPEIRENKELYGFLKRALIKGVEVPAEDVYIDGKKVAFTCPFCAGHTMLTYGTIFYHCTKCGQKISPYGGKGIWGAVQNEEAEQLDAVISETEAGTKTADFYEIGNEYTIETEIGKGEHNEPIIERHAYMLIGKYKEYGLFECIDGAVPYKKAIRWNEVKEV